MAAIIVASVSRYVAIATYQQSVKDSEEQQKNLEASREQLQAVVETLRRQHGTLAKGLETSKNLFALQKEQQEV